MTRSDDESAPVRGAILMLSLLCLVASGAAAAGETAAPAARPGVEPAEGAGDPGADPEGGPLTYGEQLRRWTHIPDAQLHAADPSFRHWAELIRTGLATKPVMRLHYFYRWRLDPFDRLVPEGWRERGVAVLRDEARTREGIRAFEAEREARRGDAGTPPAGSIEEAAAVLRGGPGAESSGGAALAGAGISASGVWVPIGPWDIAGRTTGLDRPRNQPNVLYAATADGGVWRTRDSGQTWETLSDFEPTLSGGSILLDPSDPHIIYFGTGEGNGAIDNYPGIGVLKSTDEGRTWTQSNNFSSTVRALAMHGSNPNRIYAAGDGGCYVSNDAGANFSLINGNGMPGGTNGGSAVLVRPDNANTVYCALWGNPNGGIYRSTDGGTNWTLLTNGLPAIGSVGRIALAISRSNPDILIAGIDQGGGRVYKTTDTGNSWTNVSTGVAGYCSSQCWYDNTVGIDPANPDIMYAGGVSAYRTINGGGSWSNVSSGVHVDQHAILTPAGGEVFLANDGGIYRSLSHGASGTWVEWSLGMDTTQYYGICRHGSDAYWAMGGTQDNGSHRRRAGDNPEWQVVLGADGGMCMTGPTSGSVVLGEYQNHNMQRSTNGGDLWFSANGGIGGGDRRAWVGIMVADPSNRNNMWTSTQHVYRSKDARATSWVKVGHGLHLFAGSIAYDCTALEVSPVSSSRVYAGFDARGIYVTDNALDATVNWTPIHSTSQPNRAVRRLRAHPDALDTLYAVFSGYGSGKIWKTTNKGGSWTNITGNLPDVPVNDLVVDADNPGTVIAATDLGIYRTDNDGAHWYGWSIGYPTVSSIELTHDRSADRLRIGTHGRSMWQWQESQATPTAVPDGALVPGTALRAERIGTSQMRVHWDVRSCTARDYNLYVGDLDDVASYAYSSAVCGLGTSGRATVALPATASGSAFFLVASSDGAGTEGPHGAASGGTPRPADGLGFCGITSQSAGASCP